MPNANLIELETSLKDCLQYCERNADSELARLFHKRIARTKHQLESSIATSDDYHTRWRTEEREHFVAWKQLAQCLNETKRQLRSINESGFNPAQVLYWDREILTKEANDMVAYLSEKTESIDFAASNIERIERLLDTTVSEGAEELRARKDFQRFVDVRREAISEAGSMIGEFRVAMRRVLGKAHEDYQSIFWPYAIASDEGVLF